jgi:LmbE family N-acetylglucosaminyl deacetylase
MNCCAAVTSAGQRSSRQNKGSSLSRSYAEKMLEDSAVERVLVVTAHPDDVDFGAAGTVACWTDAGIEVSYCIVTDGDAGGFDPSVARSAIAGIRQAEQTAAAKEVGVQALTFLGYPDGALEVSLALRRDISRVIRQVRPQRVVCQSPERSYDRIYGSHPDHIAAGEATFCAVYPDARNPFTFTELLDVEGLQAWTVDEVWTMNGPGEAHFVDITRQLDRKLRALLRHESQHSDPVTMEGVVRGWNGANAARPGLAQGSYAEAFGLINTR